jgi:hypothetical protein
MPFTKESIMKTRTLRYIVLAATLTAAACTHRPYHPTKSDREWTIDHDACEISVRSDIREEPAGYDEFDEMRMIKECMKSKGWRWKRTDLFKSRTDDAD